MGNKQLVQNPKCSKCSNTRTLRITKRSLWCSICRDCEKIPEPEQLKTEEKISTVKS